MKMDQIAFYCATQGAEQLVKKSFGLDNAQWIKDTVYANVIVRGAKGKNVAELQFNYDMGCEFEIIRYIDGPHWMQGIMQSEPFIAHIGIHLDDRAVWPLVSWPLVQEAETYKHMAEHLAHAGKFYSYRIHEVSRHTYIKYIRRRYSGASGKGIS